jgi:hypothetical protein
VTGGFVFAFFALSRAYVCPGLVRRRRRRRLRRSVEDGPSGLILDAADVRLKAETPLRREIISTKGYSRGWGESRHGPLHFRAVQNRVQIPATPLNRLLAFRTPLH